MGHTKKEHYVHKIKGMEGAVSVGWEWEEGGCGRRMRGC